MNDTAGIASLMAILQSDDPFILEDFIAAIARKRLEMEPVLHQKLLRSAALRLAALVMKSDFLLSE